ncbi:glycosyltransferase family 4 protein [Caldiplasma sukawensis]
MSWAKIAFICDRVNPFYFGGYEYLIYNLSQRLAKLHNVTIFTSMNEETTKINGVVYVRIAKRYRYVNSSGIHNIKDSIRFALNVYKNIDKFNIYDIVIINTIPYFLYGKIIRKIKPKKISIFHEAWHDYLKEVNPILRYLLPIEIKGIVNHSNLIVAVSSITNNSLTKNYGAKNVITIPIGIELEPFFDEVEQKYDIIYLGRLASIKHIDTLIKAVRLVTHKIPDVSVCIGGEGDELDKLVELTRKLKLEKNIFFIGKYKDEEKFKLLRSSKIFVLPSEREGYSISTLEAMYCGAVPIVSKPKYDEVFGCSDFVINNVTGLYFSFGNIIELKEKIIYLLLNKDILSKLKYNAQNISKKFSWVNVLKKYEEAILTI